ncbi:MAG: rRNA pseudouridine synthase [Clostridia bacterium]|nr:rRNA pseudouridine synthase [Clostridia bacterium]
MAVFRLDRFIATQAGISRSEASSAVKAGRVRVNNKTEKNVSAKIDAENDRVFFDGNPVEYSEFVYIMLNKPAGVLSASRDPKMKTVVDLVPDSLRRKNLFPAGRLDRDSVGLIILTDDGQFCHRLLSPKKHVYKTYFVRLDGAVPDSAERIFGDGAVLEDGTKCLPARLFDIDNDKYCARVQICEGKFHQVKRMFNSVGLNVIYLKREGIGPLSLDEGLAEGQCRALKREEVYLMLGENP